MANDASLSRFSETSFDFKAAPKYPVGNPTLDLCAVWDAAGRNIFVYRHDGQVVSKVHQIGAAGTKAPDALTVTWRPDGHFLAVGWSDGMVRLVGLETNKTVHHFRACEDTGKAKICHIGWATSIIVDKTAGLVSQKLERLMSESEGENQAKKVPDLPEELKFLEVDTALPKISPLPTGSAGAGDDAMVFTLRSGIEFLFRAPSRPDHDRVNVMIVGTDSGNLHLSVYDSFMVGTLPCPILNAGKTTRMVSHAWSKHISTQALLLTDDEPDKLTSVHLVPMDLPFISSSPINLSLLASKLTTLQTLLRYFKQAQLHMTVEWKNARELPSRFLRSVQEDLQGMESGPRDIIAALYHTAVTGHAYGPVKEWMVDTLGDRGHKRWDKAVTSGLENLRSLVHENLLPSLDRASIILSRLRGLARYYDSRDDLGFTTAQLNRILDIISCLSLVGNKILLHVMDELDHFQAFSSWLKFMIDRLSSTTSAADELTEKEATLNTSKVLTYMERYLIGSPLDGFFDEMTKDDYQADWQHVEDGPSLLVVLDRQLQKQADGQPHMKALPHIDFLVNYATVWSSRIFKDVADAKGRSVRFGEPSKMTIGAPISTMDTKMVDAGRDTANVHTALASKEQQGRVTVFRTQLTLLSGISTSHPTTACTLFLQGRKIIDVKILDESLVILCTKPSSNETELLSVHLSAETLPYTPYQGELPAETSLDDIAHTTYVLPPETTIRGIKLEVHGKTDIRGAMPARISMLASNRTAWVTLSAE